MLWEGVTPNPLFRLLLTLAVESTLLPLLKQQRQPDSFSRPQSAKSHRHQMKAANIQRRNDGRHLRGHLCIPSPTSLRPTPDKKKMHADETSAQLSGRQTRRARLGKKKHKKKRALHKWIVLQPTCHTNKEICRLSDGGKALVGKTAQVQHTFAAQMAPVTVFMMIANSVGLTTRFLVFALP